MRALAAALALLSLPALAEGCQSDRDCPGWESCTGGEETRWCGPAPRVRLVPRAGVVTAFAAGPTGGLLSFELQPPIWWGHVSAYLEWWTPGLFRSGLWVMFHPGERLALGADFGAAFNAAFNPGFITGARAEWFLVSPHLSFGAEAGVFALARSNALLTAPFGLATVGYWFAP